MIVFAIIGAILSKSFILWRHRLFPILHGAGDYSKRSATLDSLINQAQDKFTEVENQ